MSLGPTAVEVRQPWKASGTPASRLSWQSRGWDRGVRALFQALSFLGSELFFLLLVPLVYWTIDARAGMRIGLILLIS